MLRMASQSVVTVHTLEDEDEDVMHEHEESKNYTIRKTD